ncbi:AAA family ATPase [Clostridium sp. chh4-2]|uniref:AAA family ATPase n=1 Tax=Clostridium sp. chh4-2 TaxID=2067550 RepID=UPI000CCF196D|nr:AAA family ATPase [Clostridium sp. chh4-2]PNV64024.1 AAA family ATPase [Clostridium sp. chh4-2]
MRLLKISIQNMPRFKGNIDIDFITKQRVAEDDKEKLFHVFSNIYTNQAISFIGINASGKTTILKAVSFVFNLLNNEALNNIKSKEILNDLSEEENVKIFSFFYNENCIYKLETVITKKINTVDNGEKLVITDERLWEKDVHKVKTKKSLFDFKNVDIKIERNQKEQFLLDDVSIMIAINKEKQSNFPLRDMLMWTNHNMLNILGRFPRELLTFLDPSIEYFKCNIEKKQTDIRLKFYESEEIILNRPSEIEKYLSSGTIKGINVFMNALLCFVDGGYLIVDELENHFNEEIVTTLVRFFMNPNVNKNGATLIYSTHYSELLDEFERNDCIYIVRNRGGIYAENLSIILKRNDIKKSEAYESGYLEGTVPVYDSYLALKKILSSVKIRENENGWI